MPQGMKKMKPSKGGKSHMNRKSKPIQRKTGYWNTKSN